MTQQYRLASMTAWLSSIGISRHSLLPHITLILLSTVDSSPHPKIAPQSLNTSSQLLHLLGDLHSCLGCSKDCLILTPFRLPQISSFTLSLKCFSSDSDNCPDVGIRPLLQSPHLPRAGPVLLMLLFFPPYSFNLLKEINKFLHLIEFCVVLYLLCWSGTLVHSQLVFCMHFCV